MFFLIYHIELCGQIFIYHYCDAEYTNFFVMKSIFSITIFVIALL